jgi:endonuclease/exonuclease/phosphatase family metal-dependent hydrolase
VEVSMRIRFCLFVPAALLLAAGCAGCDIPGGAGAKEEPGRFSAATWNLQALFDGEEGGNEYAEYRESAGWNREKYQARLTAISQALEKMTGTAPDLLAFQEAENLRTLEDLARGDLAGRGYGWTFFAGNPGASLGIGVLSRHPFTLTRVHSLNASGETVPRPVLEIWLEVQDRPLVFFICHWKSKLGGDEATEALRRGAARILRRRLGEIETEFPGTPVIIMGDLNENHDEFYRHSGAMLSALMPDDPKAAELAGGQGDFLVLSRKKPPESLYFGEGAGALYSPWGNELIEGSYNYKGAWETIDHFLLNGALYNGKGWDFLSCRVIKAEPFINSKGYPNTYNPRNGGGLSDHLPLLLELKLSEAQEGG